MSDNTNRSSMDEFHEVFRSVLRSMRAEWNKHVEKEISNSQTAILELLQCRGPQKVTDLAVHLDITSGAVTGLCDKLIAADLAVRKRDEEDRRVVFIDITSQGEAALERVRALRMEVVSRMFKGLSDDDLQHLIRIFRQVMSNIE